jgi:hypothetical protein
MKEINYSEYPILADERETRIWKVARETVKQKAPELNERSPQYLAMVAALVERMRLSK